MDDVYVRRAILENGVAIIEFFHPRQNALPGSLLEELAEEITTCSEDPSVSVVVLQSGGDRTFCAGASFDELVQIESAEQGKAFFSGFARVINACRTCSKLIIGRVQGKAVGGGVGLAAAVDYCLATRHAAIRLSELNIGIGPFVIEPAVSRKIGLTAFTQLTLHPDDFQSAEWAMQQGLYGEVYENTVKLDEAVKTLSSKLAATNPEAREALKKTLWEGTDNWSQLLEERAAMSGRLVLSRFTKEALAQFKGQG